MHVRETENNGKMRANTGPIAVWNRVTFYYLMAASRLSSSPVESEWSCYQIVCHINEPMKIVCWTSSFQYEYSESFLLSIPVDDVTICAYKNHIFDDICPRKMCFDLFNFLFKCTFPVCFFFHTGIFFRRRILDQRVLHVCTYSSLFTLCISNASSIIFSATYIFSRSYSADKRKLRHVRDLIPTT